MAIINVDDAYILNETGAQVDKTTGIPFKNESLTEAEAAQARANIRAGGSNRNLLDNWYFVGGGSQLGDGVFPINQREQTTYTGGNAFDRWRNYTSNLTLNSNGVTIAPTAYGNNFLQFLPSALWDSLVGKTLTLSFDVAAITGSFVISAYNTAAGNLTQTGITSVQITIPSGVAAVNRFFGIGGNAGNSVTLRAVKLEIGSVSTLANDAPPDYAEELAKCKRYFERIKAAGSNLSIMTGFVNASGHFYVPIQIAPKRANPSVTVSASLVIGKSALNLSSSTSVYVFAESNETGHYTLDIVAAGLTADDVYRIGISNGQYMDFSADL